MTSSNNIEIYFPKISLLSIDNNEYKTSYFVSAYFNSDESNLYIKSNKTYYATEKLYIIGAIDKDSDITLVIRLKSIGTNHKIDDENDDEETNEKKSQVYMCFPLQNSKKESKNKINEIKKIINNKDIDSLNINDILSGYENDLEFIYKKDSNDYLIDNYVYKFKYIFDVYDLSKLLSNDYKWLTKEIQKKNYLQEPFDFSILDTSKSDVVVNATIDKKINHSNKKKEGFKEGAKNKKDTGIYMECKPSGESEETTPMKLVSTSSKKSSQSFIYAWMFATIMIIMLIVYNFQETIYCLLSNEFKTNIGITTNDEIKNNTIPKMYFYFLADILPHFWKFLTVHRQYLDYSKDGIEKIREKGKFFQRCVFWAFYVILFTCMTTTKKQTKAIFIFIFMTLLFSQLLFFTMMMKTDINTLNCNR